MNHYTNAKSFSEPPTKSIESPDFLQSVPQMDKMHKASYTINESPKPYPT